MSIKQSNDGISKISLAAKLCTFVVAGDFKERIGIETPGGNILDMNGAYALTLARRDNKQDAELIANETVPPDMVKWLELGEAGRAAVREMLDYLGPKVDQLDLQGIAGDRLVYQRTEVQLLAPVPRPRTVRDAGGFLQHARKLMSSSPDGRIVMNLLEANPLYINFSPTSVSGTDRDILWPSYSEVLDYELEMAVVIGREGRDIPLEEAKNYIAGYTVYNDVSARDYHVVEAAAPLGSGKGKNWDGSNLFGPFLVTPDLFDPDKDNNMIVRVNGEEWSRGLSSSMEHKFAEIISFISQGQTLYPGELIGSGTVNNGSGIELHRYINPGDVVELEVEGIGILRNRFVQSPTSKKLSFPPAIAMLLPRQLNTTPRRKIDFIEVAPKVYAGIQETRGEAAFNNTMYVASGEGLVADTCLDLPRTQMMIDLFKGTKGPWPPKYLINSHNDHDHVWGNQLFKGSEIIGHHSIAKAMLPGAPKDMILMYCNQKLPSSLRDFFKNLGEFDLRGIVITPPTRLLKDDEILNLDLGDVPVEIRHMGHVHRPSDTIVFLPKQRVLFAGDLVFGGLTPHITGPSFKHVIDTYKYLESLAPDVVVPGHGPLVDGKTITRTRAYFEFVHDVAKRGYDKGLSALEAAKQTDLGEFAEWTLGDTMMISLNTIYRELRGPSQNAEAKGGMEQLLAAIVEAEELRNHWKAHDMNNVS